MTSTPILELNGHVSTAPVLPSMSCPAVTTAANCRERYRIVRQSLVKSMPEFAAIIPEEWPSTPPPIDGRQTIACLRQATATYNEGLLIIGYGDGQMLDIMRQDAIARCKIVNVIIFDSEALAFAHSLGAIDMQPILTDIKLGLHYARNANDLQSIITLIYNDHGQIAQLAGTTLLDMHPLAPEAEAQRAQLRPFITKALIERYDCLGNDVYDTFLGARNALMHGSALWNKHRAHDYHNRYAGKTALCIASGPSSSAHFARIREIQHEHVLICADSILGGLLAEGIQPDFVCMVERPDNMHRLIDGHAENCSTVLVALPVVHSSSAIPFGERVCWWWNGDELYPWLDPKEPRVASGRSAGTLTVAFALMLGVKTAYLVGHDLAYQDGRSHCSGVAPLALETNASINSELSRDNPNYYRRSMETPKNGGGMVETMGVWEIFRSDLELILAGYGGSTTFINVNIPAGIGAVINNTVSGELPASSGIALEKSHPVREFNAEAAEAYRKRSHDLVAEFASLTQTFEAIDKELAPWKPLAHTREQVEEVAARMDIIKLISEDNSAWFAYVFRAALRNLMMRLHQNTFVRTMAERNWSQVQVMRTYLKTMPRLLERLRPELEKALESWK